MPYPQANYFKTTGHHFSPTKWPKENLNTKTSCQLESIEKWENLTLRCRVWKTTMTLNCGDSSLSGHKLLDFGQHLWLWHGDNIATAQNCWTEQQYTWLLLFIQPIYPRVYFCQRYWKSIRNTGKYEYFSKTWAEDESGVTGPWVVAEGGDGRRMPACAGGTCLNDPHLPADPPRGFGAPPVRRPQREGGGKSRIHGADWLPVCTGRGKRRWQESGAESCGGELPVFVAGRSG